MPPRLGGSSLPKQSFISHSQCKCQRPLSRPFSSTPSHHVTAERRRMYAWFKGPGKVFKNPLPGSTNYLSAYDSKGQLFRAQDMNRGDKAEDETSAAERKEANKDMNLAGDQPLPFETEEDLRPFPLSKEFRSEAVLAEEIKDAIYNDVTKGVLTIREASEKYRVEMNRIGAVVRLKSVEAQWQEEGKPLATVYGREVLAMLPQTTLKTRIPHESINDLPVHQSTTAQLFYPASESRAFTRADAGEVFMEGLKPADERIPHPEMVTVSKGDVEGLSQNMGERRAALKESMRKADAYKEKRARREDTEKLENTTVVHKGRWDYRFQDVKVDASNTTSHFVRGIGARYGVPPQDRKKGAVKIPKRVL